MSQDAAQIGVDVAVPEVEDDEALADEVCVAVGIAGEGVLAAIGLDYKTGSGAVEVEDIGAKRDLAAELQTVELAGAEGTPKDALGLGLAAAQAAGGGGLPGRLAHAPRVGAAW